jgi:hypothetical protein
VVKGLLLLAGSASINMTAELLGPVTRSLLVQALAAKPITRM